MWHWRSSRTAVIGVAVLIFGVCSLLPSLYVLVTALGDVDGLSALLLDARQRGLLITTAVLGLGTTVVAASVGVPLGAILARSTLPAHAGLRAGLTAPVLLPPYIVALAWTYLAGHGGWMSSLSGAATVLGLVLYPIPMLATEVALRRVDARLEEAGLLVATPRQVLRRITLPLVAPPIVAASLVVFVLAISDFAVPGLLGVRVYTTESFTAFAALYDVSRAMVLALPLLFLCVGVASMASAVMHATPIVGRRTSSAASSVPGVPTVLAGAVVLLVAAVALAFPVAMLANEARGVRSWSSVIGGSAAAMWNSLWLAGVGATLVVGVAFVIGYANARLAPRPSRMVDALLVTAFGVPSSIVGIGLIALWNRPGPLGAVYGTESMLVLGYIARFLPVAALVMTAATRHLPLSQEEAAAVAGAGWLRSTWHVVVPQVRLAMFATWMLTFILAFGELGVSLLVAPPGESTLPIRVYTLIANAPSSQVAGLALLQAVVILLPVALIGTLGSSVWTRP
jgi:iron(III) transport system permease protein